MTTYNALVSALQESLEDDSQETLNFIPTAIQNAEYRLLRETDYIGIEIESTVTATQGIRIVNKPSGYRLGKQVRFITSSGEIQALYKQTKSFCEMYWLYANASVAQPKYYSDWSNTEFLLSPTPDADYLINVGHVVKPVGVSTSNQTNEFTEWMPDALFHASMSEMANFTRNSELKTFHEQSYINSMIGVNNESRRARRDEGMQPLNRNIQVNTLKGEN